MTTTPDLIEALAAKATPVRRLAPPLRRAVVYIGALLAVLCVATVAFHAWPVMLARLTDVRFAIEMAATTVTGLVAVVAAFYLSVPGHNRFWLLLPLFPLAVWLGSAGYGCYRNWFVYGADGSLKLGRSADCFEFIIVASIPMAVALFFALRRARPLEPAPVMAIGALGVAGLAAAALQFFHPFDVTVTDLALHILAVVLVVAFSTRLGGSRLVRPS